MRRFVFLATLILAIGVAFYFWPRESSTPPPGIPSTGGKSNPAGVPESPTRPRETTTSPAAATPGRGAVPTVARPPWDPADFPIAAPLNAPGNTLSRDLDIVHQVFDAWLSNFPHEGNPVGENAEITAALTGDNRLQLALIPKGHPAVNDAGELCDRWGTPFRFHQISGTRMEIRSAGPDRKFATEDDGVWSPPP